MLKSWPILSILVPASCPYQNISLPIMAMPRVEWLRETVSPGQWGNGPVEQCVPSCCSTWSVHKLDTKPKAIKCHPYPYKNIYRVRGFLSLLISIAIYRHEFLAAWDACVKQAWTRKKTCFRLQSFLIFLNLLDHRNSNSWATTPHKHNMIWDRLPKTYITPEKWWLEHYFPLGKHGKTHFHALPAILGDNTVCGCLRLLCVVVYVFPPLCLSFSVVLCCSGCDFVVY